VYLDDHSVERDEDERICLYTITAYPTNEFRKKFVTGNPIWYAVVVVGVFLFASLMFALLERFLRRRTDEVVNVARKQDDIVSRFFPKMIQETLMDDVDENEELRRVGKEGIRSYLTADKDTVDTHKEASVQRKPIAGTFR